MYYDRNAEPIAREDWARLHALPGYMRIARTVLPDGHIISTIWVGIDLACGLHSSRRPLIFETMVFAADGEIEYGCRLPSEAAALADHKEVVAQLRGPTDIEQLIAGSGD